MGIGGWCGEGAPQCFISFPAPCVHVPPTTLPLGKDCSGQPSSCALSCFAPYLQTNGLVNLAQQLIAAKLNLAIPAPNTPSVPAAITAAIRNADALIKSKVVPPVGRGYLSPDSASNLVDTLSAYNEGRSAWGPALCK